MPFCKICFDSGNSDYSTHNIKFYNTQLRCVEITCPYLKNITCTRCGKKSHTASYCKESIVNINSTTKSCISKTNSYTILNDKDFDLNKNNNSNTNQNPNTSHNLNSITKSISKTNMFSILIDDVEESISEKLQENISYTADNEILGKLSDIIWGKGISNENKFWADKIV